MIDRRTRVEQNCLLPQVNLQEAENDTIIRRHRGR
jgi:hypothetical protein